MPSCWLLPLALPYFAKAAKRLPSLDECTLRSGAKP
jgi:hypothetical protein